MKKINLKICARCVMDETVPDIRFDKDGVCQFCKIHDELEADFPLNETGAKKLRNFVKQIQKDGQGRPYDIVVGVSGGRDSCFGLYQAVQLGLRPLAVHFDNGWNSEIAVTNIKKITSKLDVDLMTYVVDWEEFKDIQKSFLKASVSDAEIPTDVAIHGILHRYAAQEKIKYILFCHSFRTEGFAPIGWTYMDGKYIRSVQKKFGTKPFKTFPNFTLYDFFFYRFIKGIKVVPLLALIPYNQKEVDELLKNEFGWTYYGGHHHESYYTHFFQSFYLPQRFKIDKRKIEYSALIRGAQMTRDEALKDINQTPYHYDPQLVNYTIQKLGLTKKEFDEILSSPVKSFKDYPSYYPMLKNFKPVIKSLYLLNLIPKHLYLKYLG